MVVTVEEIDAWRALPSETQILEFKEAKNQFDNRKLFEYCVAIANEGGGHLILGIQNNPPREVVGTHAFKDPVEMADKIFQKVGFRVDIDVVHHPKGRVLVFNVPRRPPGTPCHLEGRYLMRSGECLVAMTPDQLRKIFDEGKPEWLERFSEIGELSPDAVVSLLDTQAYFERIELPYPSTREAVLDRLVKERLIFSSGNKYWIKRLGAVLLAKRMDEFPDVKKKAPRVVVYTGGDKFSPKLNRFGNRGYAAGYKGMVNFIMAQLPQNEVIEDALRKEVKMVPEIVVRELVANALIHQDFAMSGAWVNIEVFSNRIDISNPGLPLV